VNRGAAARPRQAVLVGWGHTAATGLPDGEPLLMVDANGRPFLAHVVDLLRNEGFTRFLMLVGHASAAAREYFGGGDGRAIRIAYASGMESLPPAAQILAARSILDEHFLLLHADTYWPMHFDAMWEEYAASGAMAMTAVYSNRDGYALDTVKVSGGFVELFGVTGQTSAHGALIGYSIVRREALNLMASQDGTVESALFPSLVERRALAAYPTEHRFYGVNTPERLAMARVFLSRGPAVIIDCDGVLNPAPEPPAYARSVVEFEWLPGALEALRVFRGAGYRIIVVCLMRGQASVAELEGLHDLMRRGAHADGGGGDAI
jgi:choline kinase